MQHQPLDAHTYAQSRYPRTLIILGMLLHLELAYPCPPVAAGPRLTLRPRITWPKQT